jgi:hypothetical protein
MATIERSNITANIPAATDPADIVAAFTDYHTSIADDIDEKASKTNPTFVTAVTAPNVIATTSVTGPTITSTTTHTNVHTITLIGQATSAVRAARYYPAAAASYDANTATVTQTRVIVSQNTPATANLVAGDIWISWS